MSSTKFIKEFETQEMSKMMSYYHAVFNSVFPLYHLLIKNYSYTYYKELVFLILEYLNLISFIFSKPVSLYYLIKHFLSILQSGIIILVLNCLILQNIFI